MQNESIGMRSDEMLTQLKAATIDRDTSLNVWLTQLEAATIDRDTSLNVWLTQLEAATINQQVA